MREGGGIPVDCAQSNFSSLIYLFDENKALATIASYRTAIGAIHSGFPDGSSVSSSVHLSRLLRFFFLVKTS